jgi:hypothetical protein
MLILRELRDWERVLTWWAKHVVGWGTRTGGSYGSALLRQAQSIVCLIHTGGVAEGHRRCTRDPSRPLVKARGFGMTPAKDVRVQIESEVSRPSGLHCWRRWACEFVNWLGFASLHSC